MVVVASAGGLGRSAGNGAARGRREDAAEDVEGATRRLGDPRVLGGLGQSSEDVEHLHAAGGEVRGRSGGYGRKVCGRVGAGVRGEARGEEGACGGGGGEGGG